MIEDRPSFSLSLSYEEFKKHYWYRNELSKICSSYGVSPDGTKADLELKIKKLLSNKLNKQSNLNEKKNYYRFNFKKNMQNTELTLDSGLLESNFKFNEENRNFFASILKIKNFKFNKQMAAALREAKKNNNRNLSVRDLLFIYLNKKNTKKNDALLPDYMNPEEQTYQWNTFVKDFNADIRSKVFSDKMKVAALLWSKIRNRPGLKKYTVNLIDDYEEDIKIYKLHLKKKERCVNEES